MTARFGTIGAEPATRVIVTVCTYLRNVQLDKLLHGLLVVAERSDRYAIGVVIVDDTASGRAKPVAAQFDGRFELGLEYRISGRQNISVARNIGLDVASSMGDWIVMTDDDCVPDPDWIDELLAAQRRTGADAVSGPEVRRAPPSSPGWLTEQPFLEEGLNDFSSDAPMSIASTHNSMLSSRWLRDHPLQFQPELGRLGGEDMVFFKSASDLGLKIHYARHALVYEDQSPERCTYRYLLRYALWLGNSQYVTMTHSGTAGRLRMTLHGLRELQRAIVRPLGRARSGRRPHMRFALASSLRAAGILAGAVGIRINHH